MKHNKVFNNNINNRIVNINKNNHDVEIFNKSIRPKKFDEFIGQKDVIDNIKIFVQAAKERKEALDHVLFFGPPGLGKTTLASIMAYELGVSMKHTTGPAITKAGELAAILTNLKPFDVLFIDEIHRLNIAIEEILYPAMEDFKISIIIGEGPGARSINIDIPPFTLIGATTKSGLLSLPLRDRFGIMSKMEFYNVDDLCHIIKLVSNKLNIIINNDGAYEIAKRSRGTARIAIRLLKRVRDFSQIAKKEIICKETADESLTMMNITENGLDLLDQRYISIIRDQFNGGPVGLDTIAAAMAESKETIEDVIESYLIQQGIIQRTPRGRILCNILSNI